MSISTLESGQQQQFRLPLVELKGPVFHSGSVWQPGRSLEAAAAAAASAALERVGAAQTGARTRDLQQQLQEQQQQQQAATPRAAEAAGTRRYQQQQLFREASQITMATVAMDRRRRAPHAAEASPSSGSSIELDGRHLSAVGQRRGLQKLQQQQQQLPTSALVSTATDGPSSPSTTAKTATALAGFVDPAAGFAAASSSLPFMRRHLRRHRTLMELTLGQDRLIVDAFAEAPTPAEHLAGRMRACAGEPTPGQAKILEQQRLLQLHRQQLEQQRTRRRLSRREKTAETISRAILTFDRSL